MLQVKFQWLKNRAANKLPVYTTSGSSGMDIFANITKDVLLPPHRSALINTNFAMLLPFGYEAQIRTRSGLALKYGVIVLNSPATIDCDYRDEVKVILHNTSDVDFKIENKMRIAQMVIAKVETVEKIICDTITTSPTSRRGGFGSTGLK